LIDSTQRWHGQSSKRVGRARMQLAFVNRINAINQSIFIRQCNYKQTTKKVWQAARTGNSPTKLATLDRKTDRLHTTTQREKENMKSRSMILLHNRNWENSLLTLNV